MRKVLLGFVTFLLTLVILIGLPLVAMAHFLSSPGDVKGLLDSQTTYVEAKNALSQAAIDNITAIQDNPRAANKIDPQLILPLIDRYFTYDFYKRSLDTLVDASYDWLKGKTDVPEFTIAITNNPTEFRNLVTDVFTLRYSSLPFCKPSSPELANYDALSASCKTSSISTSTVRATILKKLNHLDSKAAAQLFKHGLISTENLNLKIDPQVTSHARLAYHWLSLGVFILIAKIALLLGLIWLLSQPNARKWRSTGTKLLIPSALSLMLALGIYLARNAIVGALTPKSTSTNQSTTALAQLLGKKLITEIDVNWLASALLLVLIGAGLIWLQHWLNHRKPRTNSPEPPPNQPPAPHR